MIKINYLDNKYKYNFDIKRLAKRIANTVFNYEHIDLDISLCLSIVNTNSIKHINNGFRSINKPTDVLSFPNINFNKPCNFKQYISKKSVDASIIDFYTKTIFLGDVVICNDIMKKQAKLYGHSIKREFSFLFTHSLLHLLGYDHTTLNDEKLMFKKQEDILQILNINR